jgi:hypothetical protein
MAERQLWNETERSFYASAQHAPQHNHFLYGPDAFLTLECVVACPLDSRAGRMAPKRKDDKYVDAGDSQNWHPEQEKVLLIILSEYDLMPIAVGSGAAM